MKQKSLIPVLLAGGIGSRLWPLSREHYPKQLLALLGDDSLLQATIRRVVACENVDSFIVICNEQHRFEVLTQIAQLKPHCDFQIILEPEGRNTAAAAMLGALACPEGSQLLFLPADHLIKPLDTFVAQIQLAQTQAQAGHLVTFGIQPTYAETGYGYIHSGTPVCEDVFHIERFVEKPDAATAQDFLATGDYYWNSGMFLFPRELLLTEIKAHAPKIYDAVIAAAKQFAVDGFFRRVDAPLFLQTPNISIDYALMEHTKCAVMVRLALQWSDIGSWQSLYEYEDKDAQGNVVLGDVISIDNHNCYLRSNDRLLTAVGLTDVIAISTADCVMLCRQQDSQRVKEIVKVLQTEQRPEAIRHLIQYHPWGTATLLNAGEGFLVKRVDIQPGQSFSLHEHSAVQEHWLVLSGTIVTDIDGQTKTWNKGGAFFIPAGVRHRLSNTGTEIASLVQVQSGKIDDQDIVRYQ